MRSINLEFRSLRAVDRKYWLVSTAQFQLIGRILDMFLSIRLAFSKACPVRFRPRVLSAPEMTTAEARLKLFVYQRVSWDIGSRAAEQVYDCGCLRHLPQHVGKQAGVVVVETSQREQNLGVWDPPLLPLALQRQPHRSSDAAHPGGADHPV